MSLSAFISHRRILGADPQSTQDIPLVTDGPDRDLLHLALGQTRHQGDVTQTDRWDLLPGTSDCDLTLPVHRTCYWYDDNFASCKTAEW